MKIKQASFVKSVSKYSELPETQFPEIAVIGRSNVGKSSLINMLVQRNQLAKSSSTPGKTQLTNFFLINENWHLVDLPGYGYAKANTKKRAYRMDFMYQYFTERSQLKRVLLLIDGKIPSQKIDLAFMQELQTEEVPFDIVVTKIDKINQKGLHKNISQLEQEAQKLGIILPKILFTSSEKKKGREELLIHTEQIID